MRRFGRIALVALIALGLAVSALAQTTGVFDQEIQRFVLPGTNTTGLRVHGSSTEMHLRLPAGDIVAQGGYKVAWSYAHGDNVVPNVSNSNAPIAGSANAVSAPLGGGVFHQLFPTAGSILAVAIGSNTALTAGYAHVEATIFDVSAATTTRTTLRALIGSPIGGSATRYAVTTAAKDTHTVPAGDAVGCQISTTVDIAPTGAELVCTLVVEF